MTEQQKADELSSWLGVRVRENQARGHQMRSSKVPQTRLSRNIGPNSTSGAGEHCRWWALTLQSLSRSGNVIAAPDSLQVVLSHTPFKSLLASSRGPVMVAGTGNVVEVARHYGFKQLLTPLDVARATPSIVPFWTGRAGKPFSGIACAYP